MASTACKFCEHLSIERILRVPHEPPIPNIYHLHYKSYPHQPSLAALKQSAERGCGFCQFIINCLDRTQPNWTPDARIGEPANPSIHLGLEADAVWENREIRDDICVVKDLHIRLAPQHYMTRLTFHLFTASAQIISIDDTLKAFRIGTPKHDPNVASTATFNIARRWLNECRHNHSNCLRDSLPTLPTRVIDVGTAESPEEPHLIITNGLRGDYVALSHCWGGKIATSLETHKMSKYRRSLPYADLPRNFCDAITITRNLGVRYLWIDSLCIIQDSKQDWTIEAAKMGSVYRDATVTVSAMVAANSSSGILNTYQPPQKLGHRLRVYEANDRSEEVTAELVERTHDKRENMLFDLWEHSPLTSRGWTLQEFVLSPRHIFYGRRQIFWQCPEGFKPADGEIYDSMPVEHTELSRILHSEKLLNMPSEKPDREKVLKTYYGLVQEYCKRQLTHTSDKLPAFSGIATNLHPVLGGEYLAGLWTSDLTRGLLWRQGYSVKQSDAAGSSVREFNGPPEFRKDSTAPSWSWAAAPGIVGYDHLDLPPSPWQIRYLHHKVVPIHRANPFGQVKSARIVVEGFSIPVIPTSADIDMGQLMQAANVELSQHASQDRTSITLFHPLVTTKRPKGHPSSTTMPTKSKEKSTEGDELWHIIEGYWNKNKPLPPEIEERLSDQLMVDSRDFREDGMQVLLLYANKESSYWAEGTAVGLMVRAIPGKDGEVYERVGYVQLFRVRMKWLGTLKTRAMTLL
ncbi:HET-domain-containing protein [Byssothecium circinans]|uniref:HET-domain-containing protein n=1 Tax=Byssothecium circinans TaxID=147558 RepID=A0A6A5U756_9PLEO|nr:HET-domain-containing protein [Byssothecium circinans]